MPHELNSVDVDLHGWDRPRPRRRLGPDRIRHGVKLEQRIKMVVEHWLQRFSLVGCRLRVVDENRHLGIHVWAWDPNKGNRGLVGVKEVISNGFRGELVSVAARPRFRSSKQLQGNIFLKERTLGGFVRRLPVQRVSKDGLVIPLDLLEERLEAYLEGQRKPVRVMVYSLNDLVPQTLYKSIRELMEGRVGNRFKAKVLLEEGCQLLALLAYYPVGSLVVNWLKRGLETEKRAKFYRRQLEMMSQFRALVYGADGVGSSKSFGGLALEGFRLEMAGRLGGVDMAGKERVQGGVVPRERLSAGVLRHNDAAETAHGLFGIQLYSHYRELGSF